MNCTIGYRVIGTNNNWKDSQASEIQATGLAPLYDSEAAMLITLDPGAYTAIVRDANGGAGIGLVEVYDQDRGTPVKLANISTRGYIETGDNVMIGGFILGNEDIPALVVIRALGPSLAKFGITEWLPDPTLELHDANGVLLQSNDNWRDSQEAEITATGLAPENNAESAIITTLPPSAYTAIVAGKTARPASGWSRCITCVNAPPIPTSDHEMLDADAPLHCSTSCVVIGRSEVQAKNHVS